jgi:hypothetical protein
MAVGCRAFFEGVALKLLQGDTVPLTPFLPAFGVVFCSLQRFCYPL